MKRFRKWSFGKKAGYVLYLLPLVGLGLLAWWGIGRLDREDPVVQGPEHLSLLGRKTTVLLKSGDASSGLRELKVTLTQEGQEKVLLTQVFPPGGEAGREVEIPVTVEPQALGLKEGKAVFSATARDRSWRGGFRGRAATWTREVVIDLVPLNLAFVGVNHLLHYGGTGLILYHLNKEVKESGVLVDGRLFRGYPLPQGDKGDYLAFFAVPLEPKVPLTVELVARPALGEEVKKPVPLKLKPRKWRHDNMNLSEQFLRHVAATFAVPNPDPLQGFLTVNRELRQANHEKVRQVCRDSRPEPLWSGAFQRYLGKPMARFGDKRTYIFQGKAVDHQTHLGEDLASLERSPVPATAGGVVALAEPLGIYGQTVILDHGLGIFSMYSHLSRIDVKAGDKVERGARLGLTGSTGLAGGDHLHYSVMVQGEFVDPLEWWDPKWHKDQVQGMMVKKVAAAPAAAAPEKKSAARAGKGKTRKSRR